MSWTDQDPQAIDIVLSARLSSNSGDRSIHFEIDKLEHGTYRATVGNLFGSQEIIRSKDLEKVLRAVEASRGLIR